MARTGGLEGKLFQPCRSPVTVDLPYRIVPGIVASILTPTRHEGCNYSNSPMNAREELDRSWSHDPQNHALNGQTSSAWRGRALSPIERGKIKQILAACEDSGDLQPLITLASTTGGLIDDEIRRIAWPVLLGYDGRKPKVLESDLSWRGLPRHKDEGQVELDVNRSFIFYPKNESNKQLDRRKEELSSLIITVLREHPMLSYFQGFHDIVQVFLLVLGFDHASEAVAHLSLLRIRDFMLPSLSPSLAHLNLLPLVLRARDPQLYYHLSQTQPFFALAATLTLYAHDIQEYGDIARLFDFLIARPAVVSVYFFAVIVLSRRDELFEIPADEPEMLHSILSKLPKPLDLESLISETLTLFNEHPPEQLPGRAWAKVPYCSVLKTTRGSARTQNLKDGEALFEMQALQLRREEICKDAMNRIWKSRRPIIGVGLAVAVGLISFWLKKRGLQGVSGVVIRKMFENIVAIF